MRVAFICGLVCACGAGLAAAAGTPQGPQKMEFEVASIKPTAIDRVRYMDLAKSGQLKIGPQIHGDRADYIYMSLRQLIAEAYQVKPFQVVCPDWSKERVVAFDVMARMPAGSRKEDAPLMLQSLLEERFKLSAHREPRDEDVTALVVGPGGPKLTETPAEPPGGADQGSSAPPNSGGAAQKKGVGNPREGMTIGTAAVRYVIDEHNSSVRLVGSRMSMDALARQLTAFDLCNGRPVVDATGLKGEYDLAIDFRYPRAGRPGPVDEAQRPVEDASDPGDGSLTRSLRALGLELKNMRAPLEHVVVDHAQGQPTEN